MTEVLLVVYDLSHGMARSLSAQFLGPNHAIDLIPHTALVVFGKEYYFGGGIQAVSPHQFRSMSNLHPIQTISLGSTTVGQTDFEQWCRQQQVPPNGTYHAAAYDLLHRNCNHFSHDAALQGLKLNRGVPEWILRVPQTFLSSPMGQLVRPMLENMQLTGNIGGDSTAPFSSSVGSINMQPSQSTASTSNSDISAGGTSNSNPWANMSSDKLEQKRSFDDDRATSTMATERSGTNNSAILDKYSKPFLSDDTTSIPMCINKMVSAMSDPDHIQAVQTLGEALKRPQQSRLPEDSEVLTTALTALVEVLYEEQSVTFCLMLLRLVALQYPNHPMMVPVMEWIPTQLQMTGDGPLVKSIPARSMAWCVVSNHRAGSNDNASWVGTGVDCALSDLASANRPEIRQAASCFLYNHVLAILPSTSTTSDELDDDIVGILCGMMEGIATETDSVTLLRRLLVVGQLIRSIPAAKTLFADLGLADSPTIA